MEQNKLNKSLIEELIAEGKKLIESSRQLIEEARKIPYPKIKEPFKLK